MSIVVVLVTLLSCITAVVAPWLGVIFYYMLAVGQLSSLWPQHFGDSRSSLYISLATIVGLGVATATQQINWARLLVLPNLLLLLVVVMVNLSYANSPFEGFEEIKKSSLAPVEMVDTFNKILLFYFVAVLLIDTRFKLICLITAIGGVLMYYTLWANKIYVTGEYWRFGDNGRLNGPWGLYYDENYFAMLFVMATPIFYYLSVGTTSRIIRYGLWFSIPFTWHALFLTGSRGALLALGIACAYIFFRSFNKKASVVLILALVVAVVDQSGNMLTRITDTVGVEEQERDRAYIENTEESPEINQTLDPRLLAWKVGVGIVRDYPLLGVGPGNFMRAYPEYDDSEPHVAHNTFLQLAATCGLAAGLVFLYFLFLRIRNVFQKPDPEATFPQGLSRDYLNDLLNALFISFYSVAFFLDLMVHEVLYFVLLLGICKYCLDKGDGKETVRSLIDSIYSWRQGSGETAPQKITAQDSVYGRVVADEFANPLEDADIKQAPSQYANASQYAGTSQDADTSQYAASASQYANKSQYAG